MSGSPEFAPKTRKFKTELSQLLDIIIHSLYSEKEIFLRELISNACDAIDKARFDALTNPELLEGDEDWEIRLSVDPEQKTLTVSDNGIGLDADSIAENLGTIARSGTQQFMEQLKAAKAEDRPNLIGQFGVGFYSAFMVADQVDVVSKAPGQPAVRWTSKGSEKYTLAPAERSSRGTDVVLHLKEDSTEFLDELRLRSVVKKYSDFVEHPIRMEVTKPATEEGGEGETTDEVLNSRKALWLKPASEVEAAEYNDFYRQVTRDFEDPARTIHLAAEGTLEFQALLFVPNRKPFDFMWGEPRVSLQLYVQRVFIMDDCEGLLPLYLRFVRGVVDSSDLPLNVSREMLQENQVLKGIRKALVNKILKDLASFKEGDAEGYARFFAEFGSTLKEGLHQDPAHKEDLAKLLLFESTKTEEGKTTTLDAYVEGMGDHEDILYLIGENRRGLQNSPYVESARAEGREVLLLTDPIDEWAMYGLGDFQGKKLRSVDRASDGTDHPEAGEFAALFEYLKNTLPAVKDVRASGRLRESAACLVADEGEMGAHMERLMARMGRDDAPRAARILELNPEHSAVKQLRALHADTPDDPRVSDYAHLLYELAVLSEGSQLEDPSEMAQRVHRLFQRTVLQK